MILSGFQEKSFFRIGMWHSRPPRDPPPFMANAILNFHFDYLTASLTLLHESYGVFSKYLNLQNALRIITALLLCHSWVIRFRECELQSSFATESNICNRLKVCDCKMGLPSASAKYMTPKNSLLSANLNQIPNTVLWDIPPLKTPIKSGVFC